MVLDALAKASNISFNDARYGSVAEVKHKGRTFVLLKPSTYMNLSGKAISYWLQKEKKDPVVKIIQNPRLSEILKPLFAKFLKYAIPASIGIIPDRPRLY